VRKKKISHSYLYIVKYIVFSVISIHLEFSLLIQCSFKYRCNNFIRFFFFLFFNDYNGTRVAIQGQYTVNMYNVIYWCLIYIFDYHITKK
jgi:hypothetical protein